MKLEYSNRTSSKNVVAVLLGFSKPANPQQNLPITGRKRAKRFFLFAGISIITPQKGSFAGLVELLCVLFMQEIFCSDLREDLWHF